MKKIQIFIQIISILASTSAIENVIKICNEEKSILSWLHFIQNVEVETFYLNKVSNGLLKSTIETFHLNLDQLKYPKEFEIKEIFILQNDSKIFHGNNLTMNLAKEATFEPKLQSTIQIHLSSQNSKIQIISLSSFICTNGNLCGLVKQYGRIPRDLLCHKIDQGKLAFIGYFDINGIPKGPTFHILIGNSIIYNPNSIFPTEDAAYIYLGAPFALKGSFDENKQLISGHKVDYENDQCDENLMMKLKFKERNSNQQEYHYKPPTEDTFGDQPQVQDELGEEYLEVKRFDDFKGDGLVAKIDIPESSLIAQFGGFRAKNNRRLAKKYQNPDEPYVYQQAVSFCPGVHTDIPRGFEDIKAYNGTYGHKINHHHDRNVNPDFVDTARYGLLTVWRTIKPIKKGQELFTTYNWNPEKYPWIRK